MSKGTMGEIISTRRKEKGMTQRELAEMLHVTDKAVSKWERNAACPDIQHIPRLAQILEVSLEEMMNTQGEAVPRGKDHEDLYGVILKAVPLAMGVATAVTALMGKLEPSSGLVMLGVGLACIALYLIRYRP